METFVVRLWRGAEADDELRGVVQHVRSGAERPFASARELGVAIRSLGDAQAAAATRRGVRPIDHPAIGPDR